MTLFDEGANLNIYHSKAVYCLIALCAASIGYPAQAERILRFEVQANDGYDLQYSGVDMIGDVLARLHGHVTVAHDDFGSALIDLSQLVVEHAVTGAFGEPYDFPDDHFFSLLRDDILGRHLVDVVPGIPDTYWGDVDSLNAIHAGPEVVGDFEWQLTLTPLDGAMALTGYSNFQADDTFGFSFDALLVPIPEPVSLYIALGTVLSLLVARATKCRRC